MKQNKIKQEFLSKLSQHFYYWDLKPYLKINKILNKKAIKRKIEKLVIC